MRPLPSTDQRDHYDDGSTLRDARARYFEANGLGADGGYAARWVPLRAGPLRFGFPNTDARRRAVRLHDLHHVLTGYRTDWRGEFEISAWEVAGSCRGYVAAWVLNLAGLAAGLVVYPRAIFRAFARGRHSRNLYAREWDEALLEQTVGEARRALELDGAAAPRASDRLAFVGWSAAAIAWSLALLALHAAPIAAVVWLLR